MPAHTYTQTHAYTHTVNSYLHALIYEPPRKDVGKCKLLGADCFSFRATAFALCKAHPWVSVGLWQLQQSFLHTETGWSKEVDVFKKSQYQPGHLRI